MLFYEDFIKSINSKNNVEMKKIEKFSLEIKRIISGAGIGIPLVLAGLFQGYMATIEKVKVIPGVFAIVFLFLGLKQLKTTFSYKIIVDTEKKILNGEKIILSLADIESCTLEERKIGKNLQVVLDIITLDRKQIIIPLYMKNKERFVLVMRLLLNEKFFIKNKYPLKFFDFMRIFTSEILSKIILYMFRLLTKPLWFCLLYSWGSLRCNLKL